MTSEDEHQLSVGQRVRKVKGYGFPGVIVAAFKTTTGKQRYVVECTAEGCEGMLHIFNGEQLAPLPALPKGDE